MIIGITGTLGAGKGTVVDYLVRERGFTHYSASGFIVEEITRRGLEVNRDNMSATGDALRKAHGSGYIIEELCKRALGKGGNVVIEAIHSLGEAEAITSKYDGHLLAVDADIEKRYERIRKRGSVKDSVSFEKFVKDENKEMGNTDPNKQNIKAVMQSADATLYNNGSIEALHTQVAHILDTWI